MPWANSEQRTEGTAHKGQCQLPPACSPLQVSPVYINSLIPELVWVPPSLGWVSPCAQFYASTSLALLTRTQFSVILRYVDDFLLCLSKVCEQEAARAQHVGDPHSPSFRSLCSWQAALYSACVVMLFMPSGSQGQPAHDQGCLATLTQCSGMGQRAFPTNTQLLLTCAFSRRFVL